MSKINMFGSWITGVMRLAYSVRQPTDYKAGWLAFVCLFWSGALVLGANTYYVATNGPGGGATSWATATNNIQDAISLTVAGDTVLVSNGVYETGGVTNWPAGTVLTNRVAITNDITVRSANNDPTNTIIKGSSPCGPAAVRCVYMSANSWLIGFTVTNGATLKPHLDSLDEVGAGIYWGNVSNCIITGNTAYQFASGAYGTTLRNCQIIGNALERTAYNAGGGGSMYGAAYDCTYIGNNGTVQGGATYQTTLYKCSVIRNMANSGGGMAYGSAYNSTFISNSATGGYGGGAVHPNTLDHCTFIGNWSATWGGGVGQPVNPNIVRDCLFIGNTAATLGGGVGNGTTISGCTFVGNYAATDGGGLHCPGVYGTGNVDNCIIYFNSSGVSGPNWSSVQNFTNCCTTPAAVDWASGNITGDPMFVDKGLGYGTTNVIGNYRLSPNSPCINAGMNQNWMTNGVDLDGMMRIRYGTVDMGAYERLNKGAIFSVR